MSKTKLSTIIELPPESLNDSPRKSPERSLTPHPKDGSFLDLTGEFKTIYSIIEEADRIIIESMITSGMNGDKVYTFLRQNYPDGICRAALKTHGLKHSSDPDYKGAATAAFAPAAKEPEAETASISSVADSVSYRGAASSGGSSELLGVSVRYDSDESD